MPVLDKAQAQRACPGCGAGMERRSLERKPFGRVELDLCFGCHAIWFDQYESASLTPGAVMELFRAIQSQRDAPPNPIADNPRCPMCRDRLQLTHDIQRTNRISYYRCPRGDGRFTTFFQFLREKNFVRSLTNPEIDRLRVHVAQVRCSGCGAPVDVARDAQCAYCRSPISILDADAVKKTIAELDEMERRRTTIDPQAAIDGLLAGKRFERKLARIEGRAAPLPARLPGRDRNGDWVDLVEEALDFLIHGADS
jgi:hypothetical protein